MNRAWMKGNVRRTGTNIGDPYHRMLSVSLASGFPRTFREGRDVCMMVLFESCLGLTAAIHSAMNGDLRGPLRSCSLP